ncbi:MAG TPA: MarR family transcriptional regulator [Gaiellaceae bacterium]|nr:MarR family transcriptional regulator [Gaiellaceae bacterium]
MASRIGEELQRAAAFRSSLRTFLARTDDVSAAARLTPQRYDLLLMIKTGNGETSTVTELSERLALRQTAVTELVNRAEESGLVERARSPRDGRVTLLRLTGEGERRLMEAFLALRDERRALADAMGDVASAFRASVPRRRGRSGDGA